MFLVVLATLAAVFVLYFVGTLAQAEKISVHPWREPFVDEPPRPLGEFLLDVDRLAQENGLVERTLCHHEVYPVIGLFWFTPRRSMLICAWEGTLRNQAFGVKGLNILSRRANGTYLQTGHDFGSAPPREYLEVQVRPFGNLTQLLEMHSRTLSTASVRAIPFEEASPGEAWQAFTRGGLERAIDEGRVWWLDEERRFYRVTLYGMLRNYTYFVAWICRRCLGLRP